MRGDLRLKVRRGFTLIELVISMAIIGLLIALIIPGIDRSLSKNSVANDAELFKAKLEEVRLLSGSTQQIDETGGNSGSLGVDDVGYYAILLDNINTNNYFSIVRISYPANSTTAACRPLAARTQARLQSGPCFVQRVTFTARSRKIYDQDSFFIAFKAPTQQLFLLERPGNIGTIWQELPPIFPEDIFHLTYQDKRAKVKLDDYTGRVQVEYE